MMTVVSLISSITPLPPATTCLVVGICCLAAVVIAAYAAYATRGTTLTCPLLWTMVALLAVSGTEILVWSSSSEAGWASALRFCAATLTFCPTMAVLGAKRPQDWAWQFIVFSLWLVLILPAGEALLLRRSGLIEIHDARAVFLAVLIVIGMLNYLPTRHGLSALLVALGQGFLLARNLPGIRYETGQNGVLAFSLLVLLASLWALRRRPSNQPCSPTDLAWRTFRDYYGALWGLRIAQRVNAAAEMHQWPVFLNWDGFQAVETDTPPQNGEVEPAVLTTLRGLLRRFMSPQWLAAHLPENDDSPVSHSPFTVP
jgi:hypothetical protein